jgi:outer membrane receptor protein involved in Fe transport
MDTPTHTAAFRVCALLLCLVRPLAGAASSSLGTTPKDDVVELAPVEVTGSIIRRAEIEGPAPVKVITRTEIEESGRAAVSEYLLQLPEAGYSSNNENAAALGTNYRGMSVLNLRGFDPNNTLVLVDGRRPVLSGIGWNTTMFVDLNRFPTAMVERVEILQDSGTLYGSGSAGGVVNIILRKDYQGAELTARYDNSLRTDVGKRTFSLVAGTSRKRTSLTVGLTYSAQNSLRAEDTDFARSANQTARFAAKGATYSRLEETGTLWLDMFGASRFYLLINEVGGGTGDYVVREPGTETYTNTTNAPILILSGPNDARTAVAPGATVTVPGRILYVRLAPMNLARQGAENWNFSAEYTRPLGALGQVRLRSNAAYAVYRGSARAGVNLENTIGRDYYPRVRLHSSMAWTRGAWNTVVSHRYIGPYGDLNRGSGVEVASSGTFGAQISRDFREAKKAWLSGLRLTVGIDNVLDRDPSLAGNAVGYDRGNALFPQGRVCYAQLKKIY